MTMSAGLAYTDAMHASPVPAHAGDATSEDWR